MTLPDYSCSSIPPLAPLRRHARATPARGLIGEKTGRTGAEVGERGSRRKEPRGRVRSVPVGVGDIF